MIFKDKYQEQEGVPIVRTAAQLGAIENAICHELEPGVRNPEGSGGRFGKKRNDLIAAGGGGGGGGGGLAVN